MQPLTDAASGWASSAGTAMPPFIHTCALSMLRQPDLDLDNPSTTEQRRRYLPLDNCSPEGASTAARCPVRVPVPAGRCVHVTSNLELHNELSVNQIPPPFNPR
eukprot:2514794-Rhodomonas_salina.2